MYRHMFFYTLIYQLVQETLVFLPKCCIRSIHPDVSTSYHWEAALLSASSYTMTSLPTVTGYVTSCLTVHLSAGSLALSHLCTYIPWTHPHRFGDSHASASHCFSSMTGQLLHLSHTHECKLPTFGCLAYFPLLVSLMVLMSRNSTS